MRRPAGPIALLAAVLALAGPARADPPMWIVRDADSELVLFGSVHLLPPGLAWRTAALDAALARAEDLWLELPVDEASQQQGARLAQQRMLLPKGQTLDGQLSPAGRARLRRVAPTLGLTAQQLQPLRPWMAEVTLTVALAQRAGATTGGGVEQTIVRDPNLTARRRAFETVEQQVALFADAPPREQAQALEQTLREIEEDPLSYERLAKAWAASDLAALQAEALDPMQKESPALFKRLVADRNRAWTAKIVERLKGSGKTVVVVGAGHLIGPQGLPQRLRALGYRVEGP
jgi:uncharacterized protein YbaP (TraB family)